jgi:hypothetical protein
MKSSSRNCMRRVYLLKRNINLLLGPKLADYTCMEPSDSLSALLEAIGHDPEHLRSVLFQWLVSQPRTATEYLQAALALHQGEQSSLGNLVLCRGLAEYPDDEPLALFALKLRVHSAAAGD